MNWAYCDGLVTTLNGPGVALSLPGFDQARRGGSRKKRESEDEEQNDRVGTSKHDEHWRGLVVERLSWFHRGL